MGHIQVIQDPPLSSSVSFCEVRNRRQNKTAQEATDPYTAREVRGPQTLHPLRRLVVEELDLRGLDERVGDAHESELRNEDEDGERDNLVFPEDFVLSGDAETLSLGQTGRYHDDGVENKANAESLEQCDASRVSGVASNGRDEEAVVES